MAEFELKQFVDGLKGLTPDQRAVFDAVLATPDNLKYVKDGVLQKADYSRSMNELQEQETAIAEKEAAMLAHQEELTTWRAGAEQTLQTAVTERNQLQQRLRELSGTAPVKPADATKTNEPPPIDTRYVKAEDFTKAVSDVMQFPLVSAELIDLNAEHQELFGKRLPNTKKLVEDAIKEKRSIRDQWANQYKVEDRRTEVAKKAHDDEINAVRLEERTKVLSEHSLPAVRPSDRPLLVGPGMLPVPARVEEAKRPDPQRGVKAAVAAFNQGTYTPKGPNQ